MAAVRRRGETYAGHLLWQLAEADGEVHGDSIRHAFYVKYWRAVRSLANSGRVRSRKRRLATLAELVKYYPDRTQRAQVRGARVSLLPTLANVVRSAPNAVEAERRVFEAQSREVRQEARRLKRQLDAAVAGVVARVPADVRATLIEVLAKVSEYLDSDSPHSVSCPLRKLLDRLRALARPHPMLRPAVTRLAELCDVLLPRVLVGPSNVKSGLWPLAAFARAHDRVTLRRRAKDRLYELAPSRVAALPGHVARDPLKPEPFREYHLWQRRDLPPTVASYSPLLDRLIGKDAFGWFEFISLGRPPRRRRAATTARRARIVRA